MKLTFRGPGMNAYNEEMHESSVTTRLVELILKMSDEQKRSLLKELEERLFKGRRKHEREPFFIVVDYY